MLHWGLDYETFQKQPLALINRLYLLNQITPFLSSASWVQAGTVAAAMYNVNMSSKSKPMNHTDIFPFMGQGKDVMDGYDEDSQKQLHNKLGAIFG